ncbi:hypothetical protein GCM10023219_08260 [Stakelama sediminis]|nr:CAP domain-containing protein [Stakelama sediminis]
MGAIFLLTGCIPQGQEKAPTVVEPRAFAGDAPRGEALLKQAMLTVQNRARAAVGEQPLEWDDGLAADAQRYADELAHTEIYEHSDPATRGPQPEGENLFKGTRSAYRYTEMAQLWVDEKRYFRNGPAPDFSTTGNWREVAHYTQIIWANTKRMGCAMASSRTQDYLVCRYTPPGNVVGQKAY